MPVLEIYPCFFGFVDKLVLSSAYFALGFFPDATLMSEALPWILKLSL